MPRIVNKKTAVRHIIVDQEHVDRRIDNFLLNELKGLPKSRIYQMLRRGEIRVNGGRVKQFYRLCANDKVRIPPISTYQEGKSTSPKQYLINLVQDSVIFENVEFFALNKPSGIVVHSGSGRNWGVIEVMRYLHPEETGLQLVHRLDRETSGCLLLAKNMRSLKKLHTCLTQGRVNKQYIALLKGKLLSDFVNIDQPIRKNTLRSGERMVEVRSDGKHANTGFKVKKKFTNATLVKILLGTGRTHQIRVHAQHQQHPVAGDNKYGDKIFNKAVKKAGLNRLFLHATTLKISAHEGFSGLNVSAPLPADLSIFLENYR